MVRSVQVLSVLCWYVKYNLLDCETKQELFMLIISVAIDISPVFCHMGS